jgi:hypothetical protein
MTQRRWIGLAPFSGILALLCFAAFRSVVGPLPPYDLLKVPELRNELLGSYAAERRIGLSLLTLGGLSSASMLVSVLGIFFTNRRGPT